MNYFPHAKLFPNGPFPTEAHNITLGDKSSAMSDSSIQDPETPAKDLESVEPNGTELASTELSEFQQFEEGGDADSSPPTEMEPFSDFSSIAKSRELSEELNDNKFTVDTSLKKFYKPQENTTPRIEVDDTASEQEIAIDEDESISETPSRRGSILSSQGLSPTPSIPGTPDRNLIRSIDQRFQTRFNSLTSIRSGSFAPPSPNTKNQSPNVDQLITDTDGDSPWETIRWSKLRKISNQIFSETASSVYGKPTSFLAASLIVIGTSRGYILVFDYQQNLKSVIGKNTKALESGQITSLAVSADFSYVAAGYSSGHIFTWDLAKPSAYNIHISPIKLNFVGKPRSDGHVEDTSVIHLSFVGKRHSALVSGDVRGMAFWHNTVRTIMGRSVQTKRIMGRYPQPHLTIESKHKPTTLLACSPLPLGTVVQPTDEMNLVAIMTPYLLAVVSVMPSPQTEYKTGRPASASNEMGLSGALAWFPALKSSGSVHETNPRLAYSWSNVLTILEVVTIRKLDNSTSRADISLNFTSLKRYIADEAIVSIQWISRQVSFYLLLHSHC